MIMEKYEIFHQRSWKQILITFNWLLNKIGNFVKSSERNYECHQKIVHKPHKF